MSRTPEKKVKQGAPADGASTKGPGFSPKQLASIRSALLDRRSSLLEQQRNQLSALTSPERHHIADLEEMGTDGTDTDSLCALVDLSSSNIDQIDAALAKIDAGSYGICEECQEPIAVARLEFLPFAALCVGCQQQKERKEQLSETSGD